MLEINFGPYPELITERLVLRQMRDEDAAVLFRFRSDPEVMRYFGRPLMQTVEEAQAFAQSVETSFAANEGIQWNICFRHDPAMIGNLAIWRIDKTNHRGELGYLLSPDQQGKGIMTEALQAVLKFAFGTMHLHSLEANVNPGNAASIKLLERNGFVQEAYFRENFYFEGNFEDSAIFSLLAPPIKP